MIEKLKNSIPGLKENWDEYKCCFKETHVKKNTILLSEGEVSKKMFFIEKGCLRMIYYKNGRDITFQFFLEKQAVASMESFFTGQPSLFSLEAIEPSTLIVLEKKDFDMLIEKFPEMKLLMDRLIFQRLEHYAKLFLSFIKDSPRERYLELLKNNPQLLQRIPQHYIASYLGISPVSLSRIRNRIIKG